MAQHPVEMILTRQLAGYLSVPVVLVDTTGTVIFYNEPAERILGVRFEETGPIDRKEADRLIELSDDPAGESWDAGRPLEIALNERRPAHAHLLGDRVEGERRRSRRGDLLPRVLLDLRADLGPIALAGEPLLRFRLR